MQKYFKKKTCETILHFWPQLLENKRFIVGETLSDAKSFRFHA